MAQRWLRWSAWRGALRDALGPDGSLGLASGLRGRWELVNADCGPTPFLGLEGGQDGPHEGLADRRRRRRLPVSRRRPGAAPMAGQPHRRRRPRVRAPAIVAGPCASCLRTGSLGWVTGVAGAPRRSGHTLGISVGSDSYCLWARPISVRRRYSVALLMPSRRAAALRLPFAASKAATTRARSSTVIVSEGLGPS